MGSKKILFVPDGRHPVHERFAKEITKNSVHISKELPKDYDVYFVEGSYIKPIMARKMNKIPKSSKIITLFSDPRLFYLGVGRMFDIKKKEMVRYPLWRSLVAKRMIKKLDGAICIGKFSANLFRRYNKKSPMKVAYPFIPKGVFSKLEKIKPSLDSHKIVFIGHGPDSYCKGLDILIEVFKILKRKVPDAELVILGEDWDVKEGWKTKGVSFKGKQDIVPYLKESSLCLHLGRGESFGINILESMLAGVPVIVSKYTGAKEVVEKVNKNFVVPLDRETILRQIIVYFSLNKKEKMSLSLKCRRVSKRFNEKETSKHFKEEFSKLLKEIYKNE